MYLSFDFLSIKRIHQVAAIGASSHIKVGIVILLYLLLLPGQVAVIKDNFKYDGLVSPSDFLSQAN